VKTRLVWAIAVPVLLAWVVTAVSLRQPITYEASALVKASDASGVNREAGRCHAAYPTDLRGHRSGEGKAGCQHGRSGVLGCHLVQKGDGPPRPGKPRPLDERASRAGGGTSALGEVGSGALALGAVNSPEVRR